MGRGDRSPDRPSRTARFATCRPFRQLSPPGPPWRLRRRGGGPHGTRRRLHHPLRLRPLRAPEPHCSPPRALRPSSTPATSIDRCFKSLCHRRARVQRFFTASGRAMCLYVVVGSHIDRAEVLPAINSFLSLPHDPMMHFATDAFCRTHRSHEADNDCCSGPFGRPGDVLGSGSGGPGGGHQRRLHRRRWQRPRSRHQRHRRRRYHHRLRARSVLPGSRVSPANRWRRSWRGRCTCRLWPAAPSPISAAASTQATSMPSPPPGSPPDASATLFCPTQAVTRDQMATFLVRALELPPSTAIPYTDLANTTHAADIAAIAAAGITTGCGGTNYCPFNPVTRAQMASFLTRAFELDRVYPADQSGRGPPVCNAPRMGWPAGHR